jgi:hypothetical protein
MAKILLCGVMKHKAIKSSALDDEYVGEGGEAIEYLEAS